LKCSFDRISVLLRRDFNRTTAANVQPETLPPGAIRRHGDLRSRTIFSGFKPPLSAFVFPADDVVVPRFHVLFFLRRAVGV
jgi:hypothetical protein